MPIELDEFDQSDNLAIKLKNALREQGFGIKENDVISINENSKEELKALQNIARNSVLQQHKNFIIKKKSLIKKYIPNVSDRKFNPHNIQLELILVEKNSLEEKLFQWWNLVWWSMPYQHPYGRQMRFLIWDRGNNAPFGLISLQSPILKQSVRDKYLEIPNNKLDYWVNRSMYAQRVGALPPYNFLLGGKMVALALVSNEIRHAYKRKYHSHVTLMKRRHVNSDLLFITTTSAFGRSSIYNRLKIGNDLIAQNLGFTEGYGSFQIPDELYKDMLEFLEKKGKDISHRYGDGPSKKIKLISMACRELGLANYTYHGIRREYYLFSFAKNLKNVIAKTENVQWKNYNFLELEEYWHDRWLVNRIDNNYQWQNFNVQSYIDNIISKL